MASSVTYNWPTSPGASIAPTTTQTGLGGSSIVTAQLVMADADTTALITHNFLLSTTELSNGFPLVSWYPTSTGTNPSTITCALTNSVAITLTKGTAAGSGGTFNVNILRPFSAIR